MPTPRAEPSGAGASSLTRLGAPRAGGASRRGRAAAALALVRWPNAVIAAAGVLLGALWAGSVSRAAWLAAVAALALTAVANAVNDVCDHDIDLVAHPERPLPMGELGAGDAVRVAAGAGVLALVGSFAAAPALGVLSAAVLVSMVAYSTSLKRHGLPGNLLVALLASLPFLYGAWTAGRPRAGLALMALAVPLHLAREVAKDLDDVRGDAPLRRTLPLAAGTTAARATVAGASALFALLAVRFFAASALPALACAAAALGCVALAARRAAAGAPGAPRVLKGAMLLAMAAAAVDALSRAA